VHRYLSYHLQSLISLLLLLALTITVASQERPNVVIVFTDDVGFGDYGCYNPDGRIPTPSVDQLANEGILFTHAHSPAALCAPSRYAMLTGNYPWRGRSPGGTWTFHTPSQILPDQKTVANMLQEVGYRTAMFGKAGIGGGLHASKEDGTADFTKAMVEGPRSWGFDYSYILPLGHQAPPRVFLENELPEVGIDNIKKIGKRDRDFEEENWDYAQVPHRLLNAAERFLDTVEQSSRNADQRVPFLMHMCTDGTHGPCVPPDQIHGRPVKGVSGISELPDMVIETDAIVGALVNSLKRRGMYENTLICVTSDNGGKPSWQHKGHDAVGGLRGMKSTIYEGGTRVPFVISWPAGIGQPGVVVDHTVCIFDLIPTVLQLAGAKIPDTQCLDAVSLVDILSQAKGRTPAPRRYLLADGVFGGNPFEDGGNPGGPLYAARRQVNHAAPYIHTPKEKQAIEDRLASATGSMKLTRAMYDHKWKLVFDVPGNGSPVMLFNLNQDPTESNNLIDDPSQAKRVAAMEATYREILASKRSTPAW